MSKKRQLAYRLGLWGEIIAIILLYLKGYHIIGRRIRNYAGEIDLIARRGHKLVFIEVKTRKKGSNPADVLSSSQQQRITRAANLFLAQNPRYYQSVIRFDLILVHPFRFPLHMREAWV